jgi:bacillithiol biosynthesis cysteine-adding enzyme BshC
MDLTPLAHDYIYSYRKVDEFYNGNFRKLAAFQRQTDLVRSRILERGPLASILLDRNRRYGCGSPTLRNIDKLINDRACAVATGQQVGLFSGPLYTVYKALTAIKLAEKLNKNCQGYFVPIFWLASDDHDFAEIDHIKLLNKDNCIQEVRYRSPLSGSKIPASKLVLTSEIKDCIQHLNDATPNSEFKPEVFSDLSDAYQPGRSLAEAFARWMTRLFKTFGLILIDASHPDFKELGKDVFYHEISENSPSTKYALVTSEKLRQAGYHTQIQLHEGILSVFLAERERQTIQLKNGDFHIKGTEQSYKKGEILSLLEKKPSVISPNVLLRPIYQDALLPTVAYIGGPAEIAYFAQMKGVYESFGLYMPIIYPRKSLTVVEKNIGNLLRNYNLKIQDIWQNGGRIVRELSEEQIPESIDRFLNSVASHNEQAFASIKQEMSVFEPTLEKSAELTLHKMNHQLKLLEKKILKASKKLHDRVTRQLSKMKNSLYPSNRLQERVLNITPFLIKYSYAFIDKLCQSIKLDDYDHQIVEL